MDKYKKACDDTYNEIARARSMFPDDFPSMHHGYAVLLEEVDEVWDEIKKKNPDKVLLRKEAIQVAAMAIRMAAELTD